MADNRTEHTDKCWQTGYDPDCEKCKYIDSLLAESDSDETEPDEATISSLRVGRSLPNHRGTARRGRQKGD